MAGPTPRRHKSRVSDYQPVEKTFPADPVTPASNEDKRKWKGFCEIESEPVRRPHLHAITMPELMDLPRHSSM